MDYDMNNLAHHGVKGQRWGIRRYQNADGSLTEAGRKRAQKIKDEYKQLTGKKLKGKIPKVEEDPSKKKIKDLSDTELNDRIRRLQNEKTAHGLEKDLSSNGSKFVRSVGRDVLAPAAINAGRTALQNWLTKVAEDAMGLNGKQPKTAIEKLREEAETTKLKTQMMENKRKMNKWLEEDNKKTVSSTKDSNKYSSKVMKEIGSVNIDQKSILKDMNRYIKTDNHSKLTGGTDPMSMLDYSISKPSNTKSSRSSDKGIDPMNMIDFASSDDYIKKGKGLLK